MVPKLSVCYNYSLNELLIKICFSVQTFESELAGRVASLLRQRHVLSIENSTLKKQITNLQAEKMIKDGQFFFFFFTLSFIVFKMRMIFNEFAN